MNLSITNKCNRRCEYCFQKSWYLAKNEEDIKEMSLDNIEKIIQIFSKNNKNNHFKVMGGEPLLYSNLFEFLELLRKYKITITMISNITIDTKKLKKILKNYSDVITSWLINVDYPQSHEVLFLRNIKLFKTIEVNFCLSTTLLQNTDSILLSSNKILKILKIFNYREDITIRVSPMSPNHKNNCFYDYSMDIIKFLEQIWNKGIRKIHFDCTLNACEINPELFDFFETNSHLIEYKNNQCRGCGPFDILVDNSVVYCSSCYNLIKLENILNYENIEDAEIDMKKEWLKYWKKYSLLCDYKTCTKFNPAYCQGLCPAKNYIKYLVK